MHKRKLRNGWITKGIKIKKIKKKRFLSILKKQPNLTEEVLIYIAKYRMIYSRALREAKRRENDKYFLNAKNKSKAVWQVINKGIGKTPLNKHDITINWNSVEITHPKKCS